tara:strand:+ start:38991 stop:39557 length:567 start_codon:yes stop_codon:yes gene_type:complete
MIRKLEEVIILKNRFFKVFNDRVVFNEKNEGTHLKIEQTNKQDGIAILPVFENGNVLLIKNYRYSINKEIYQVVKGGNGTIFENQDIALQCAKEELEEEAGLVSKNIRFLQTFYESPSILNIKGYSFLALNCKEPKIRKRYKEETESISGYVEIKFEDLEDFLLNNEMCSTSMFLIQKYINLKLKELI